MKQITLLKHLSAFIILAFISVQYSGAQMIISLRSALSVGGPLQMSSSRGQQFSLQQSIGQSGVIGTYHSDGYILRQGFIQPLNFNVSDKTISVLNAAVFPNPFVSGFSVQINENISDDLHLSLVNPYGQIIYSNRHEAVQELYLNLENLTSGLYILKLNTGTKQYTTKLIKE